MQAQLVDHAILAPGCCGICGNRQGQMVDTGAQILLSSVEGRLYICRQYCVPAICEVAGALNPAASKTLREQVDVLQAELDQKDAEVARMRPVVLAVARAKEIESEVE